MTLRVRELPVAAFPPAPVAITLVGGGMVAYFSRKEVSGSAGSALSCRIRRALRWKVR